MERTGLSARDGLPGRIGGRPGWHADCRRRGVVGRRVRGLLKNSSKQIPRGLKRVCENICRPYETRVFYPLPSTPASPACWAMMCPPTGLVSPCFIPPWQTKLGSHAHTEATRNGKGEGLVRRTY